MRRKLFAGIALDARSRAACARVALRLQEMGAPGRYDDDARYHLTLAFLGYVDAERTEELTATMRTVASEHTGFDFSLDKIGAFPHERSPRVVYLGARDTATAFRALARALRRAYAALGFVFAQDAVAHVTLARVGARRRTPLPMLDVEPIRVRVDALTLFESLPGDEKHAPRYEHVADAPLRPA